MAKPIQRTLLLSGGGNPISNHYSQYLQAKQVQTFLSKDPGVALTTLFGSGLTPESPVTDSPDVSRDTGDGVVHFIRGEIPGNHVANYPNVQDYFKSKIAGLAWNPGDQFFLFVADHGMPNSWDPTDIEVGDENKEVPAYDNNCINLWTEEPFFYPEKQCLSVSTLKDWVQTTIPKNIPVHFVMTQCFSGGFHLLGYHKDEKGFPHPEGNICGFTAITDDTTAAGCTSFVNEDIYDGYERRMAEAMTGTSTLTGESIGAPTPRLSEAHDMAMLQDNTKDVPLRTSEAYLLEYWKAHSKDAPKDSDSQVELNKQWKQLQADPKTILEGLPPVLRADMSRRLRLIDDLKKQVIKWNPEQRNLMEKGDLDGISHARKGVQDAGARLEEESSASQAKRQEISKPISTQYILSLKDKKDAESREKLEFRMFFDMNQNGVIARIKKEDPTLKKLERFRDAEENWRDNMLKWAGENPGRFPEKDVLKVREFLDRKKSVDIQKDRLETVEGELRRIEVQMTASAVMVWLSRPEMVGVQNEVSALVECEMSGVAK